MTKRHSDILMHGYNSKTFRERLNQNTDRLNRLDKQIKSLKIVAIIALLLSAVLILFLFIL